MTDAQHVQDAFERAYQGGPERHRDKAREQGKLPVRERVARLLDEGSFTEDALLASWDADGLGADGVVTGMGTVGGRAVALMANDPTVKAGSWGPRTVEKILRVQEAALSHRVPMVYLVDSAGARITEQVQMFPGRRRLHPGLLRRRDHARRQRLDVPRLAADGRGGDRRARLAGGDGRGQDA